MVWDEHNLTVLVENILRAAALADADPGHHFQDVYLSPYQLAIELQHSYPNVFLALGKSLGGVGAGQSNTLGQYLANELSKKIKHDDGTFPIYGAFLSSRRVERACFRSADGEEIDSSIPRSGLPFSIFRLADHARQVQS